ncbi:MAG: hypothetical protein Q9162_007100 [Coniocarpon cinnabarinum]
MQACSGSVRVAEEEEQEEAALINSDCIQFVLETGSRKPHSKELVMPAFTPPSPTSQRPRRRSSQASERNVPTSPVHSRHTSLSHRRKASVSSTRSIDGTLSPHADLAVSIAGGLGPRGDGLGNLEDELAGAWEGEEGDEDGEESASQSPTRANGARAVQSPEARTLDTLSTVSPTRSKVQEDGDGLSVVLPNGKATAATKQRRRRDTRTTESLYDGSDYGEPDSDEASGGLSRELRMLIQEVEELARQGSHMCLPGSGSSREDANGSSTKHRTRSHSTSPSKLAAPLNAFGTFHNRLKDLGGQTTLESLTSRLITAHASLTTHLSHQTRTLQTAAFPLLSPLSVATGTGPNLADVEDLLGLVAETMAALPQPSFTSLNSISYLHATGKEAVTALVGLSDSLHMSRQIENSAARRLRSARECAVEMKKEYELEEIGRRWIETGHWEQRLKEREAKKVCREVTGGFEEVCETWRRRLVDAATAQGVAETAA